jgi:fructose-bisphosphate aldolase class I
MEQPQMNAQQLIDTAKAMVAGDKGLLAMDESNPTCNKRFAKLGIPQTEEARRAYRELIVTTPGLGSPLVARSSTTRRSASRRRMALPL